MYEVKYDGKSLIFSIEGRINITDDTYAIVNMNMDEQIKGSTILYLSRL